jgi:hypothetical protein
MGCGQHPAFPAPSFISEGNVPAKLGRNAPREREGVSAVIASEAKQSIAPRNERIDCFVATAPRNDVLPFENRIE